MARGRKRYRRVHPHQVRLWQARLDAVQKRLQHLPPGLEDFDREAIEHLWAGLGRLLQALARLAEVKPNAGDDADYLVLCQVLAPRLAPYADEQGNVAREALLHLAALSLDDDLATVEEFADSNDKLWFLERQAQAMSEAYQEARDETLAKGAQLLERLDDVDATELDGAALAVLTRLLRLDPQDPELEPEARHLREQLITKATRLLATSMLAEGQLPD